MAGGAQSQRTVGWGGALCFEKAPQVVLMPHPPSCAWMLTGLGPTRASWEAPMCRAPAEHCQPDRCRWRNRKLEILWHFPKVTCSAQAGTSIVWIENLFFLYSLLILTLALSERPRSQNQVNLLLFHGLISLAYFVVFSLAVGDNCPPSDVPLKKVSSPWTSTRFGLPATTWLMVSPTHTFPGSGGQFIRALFAHRRTEETQVLCCLTDSPFKLAGKLGLREVVQEL